MTAELLRFRLLSTLRVTFTALTLLSTALVAGAAPPKRVIYTVSVADIPKQTFRVTARAEEVTDAEVSFALPAWSPGWYVMTNAWKNVSNVTAKSETGKPLAVTREDNYTYKVTTAGAKNVTVMYDLLAKNQDPEAIGPNGQAVEDFGFFAPYLSKTNGFVPGPAALMYVMNGKTAPCQITYKVPKGWDAATANDPLTGSKVEPFTFVAKDYDTLADHPADLGKFQRFDKTINGKPFSVVVVNGEETNLTAFVNACWKIGEAGMRVFGNAPFPRYIFHFHLVSDTPVLMGLEHLNSTIIALPGDVVEDMNPLALSIVAHEYVHAWNVKRIRSEALGPFDYTKEVRIRDLWWLEGVTDYYAPRLMVEAGLASPAYWRGYMQQQITELQNNPSRTRVTLETASLKAWEGRSEGFDGLSYYNKGLVVGLLLDIEMRRRSKNKVGLDDLFKALYAYVEKNGKGFPDGEIERIASQLVGSDMGEFFEKTLRKTDELDYETILPAAGLTPRIRKESQIDLGLELESLSLEGDTIKVGKLVPGGPAEKSGLKSGDLIETITGKPALRVIQQVIQQAKPGDQLRLGVLRDGKQKEITLTLGETQIVNYRLIEMPEATAEQKAIFMAISGAKAKTKQMGE